MPMPMAAQIERRWLQRYLDRQLDADQSAWFEAYLFGRPPLLRLAEIDTLMRDAAARYGAWRAVPGRPP